MPPRTPEQNGKKPEVLRKADALLAEREKELRDELRGVIEARKHLGVRRGRVPTRI